MQSLKLSQVKARVKKIPVCIIIPPSPFLFDEKVFPFLGALKVAAELRKNGNNVEILDLSGDKKFTDTVKKYVKSKKIKHFGVTATTPQLPTAVKVIKTLKKVCPDSKVILGGAHTTLTHASMMEDQKMNEERRGIKSFEQLKKIADKLVIGDGERAVFYALDPKNHSQVIGDSSFDSDLFLKTKELSGFDWPARDLIDLKSYRYSIDGHPATSLIMQLGCPYQCGFCSGRSSVFYKSPRARTINQAISEMEHLYKTYGYTGFMFYDDELNVAEGSLEALCDGAIRLQTKLGVKFGLRGFVRADRFNKKQAKLMYKAGFRILLTGVESGSPDILDAMRKRTTPEINSRCREIAGAAGLQFKALMSVGHPGESEKSIRDSVQWVIKNKPEEVDWAIITPYPGSHYFDHSHYDKTQKAWVYSVPLMFGKNKGKEMKLWSKGINYFKEADFYKGIPGEYVAHVWTPELSAEDLVLLRDEAEAKTRKKLGLQPLSKVLQEEYEHSMGQSSKC